MKNQNQIKKFKKVILLYSGGLDTSVCVPLIKEKYGAEVIAVTVDTGGFAKGRLKKIHIKALKAGALKHIIVDKKKTVFNDFIAMAIKANAFYEGKYPLCTPVGRYAICEAIAKIAKKHKPDAIAHGSSGLGNEQLRFDITLKAFLPGVEVFSPLRDFNLTRDWELKYAQKKGIPIDSANKKYTINLNMWGRTLAGSEFDDPNQEPPDSAYKWVVPIEKAPDKPTYVTIDFKKGIPISLNNKKLDGVSLIKKLNKIAGKNGVGKIDMVENHVVGIKERCSYEAPAATVLITAHKDLETMVLTKKQMDFKWNFVDPLWATLLYQGLWVDPFTKDLEKFIDSTQETVNGVVKVKLYKGNAVVVGKKSPNSLFVKEFVSYESTVSQWDQATTPYFIKLWGLQSQLGHQAKEKAE